MQEVFDNDPMLSVMFNPPGARGGSERVAVLDEHGIDFQLVNPNLAMASMTAARRVDATLGARVAVAYNDWAAGAVSGVRDRLAFSAIVTLDDVPRAVEELARTKELGAKAWLMPLNPVAGRTLGDPDYDPLWRASLDLNMLPIIHVGFGWPKVDLEWLRNDGAIDPALMMRMSSGLMAFLPQTVLYNVVHRGVFDRFPELVICVEEFGLDWIGHWLDFLGPVTRSGEATGGLFYPWDHKAEPLELLERNLRFTPLRGQNVASVIDEFGANLVCYASDFPHFEGIVNDWEHFDRQLDRFDAGVQERFYRGNMKELVDF
jgi:predicted TIM-barrel fold metal-dependent hydrolase